MLVKNSKTETNLLVAFAGESQARMRYTFFSGVAKKEGYEQIAGIFLETSENEREHAKLFFTHLTEGSLLEINAAYPAGVMGTTARNLKAAAEGERLEWGTLYPEFGETAEKEGFLDVANTFRQIAKVEAYHERRYLKILSTLTANAVFEKKSSIHWKCRNCGYVNESTRAPLQCPVCHHPQSYFEEWIENY